MIPILYSSAETNFETNGIGLLTDVVSCKVTEERNGIYELVMVYPVDGHLSEHLSEDCILKVRANDDDELQLFRIYKSGKKIGDNTSWYGEHISYELTGNVVSKFNVDTVNCQSALEALLNSAAIPHRFTAFSDIITLNSTSISDIISIRKALGGVEGSILDVWGGEYHFDNYRVELLRARGQNNGLTIEYGKNLIDASQDKALSNIVTAIYPYAKYKGQGEDEEHFIELTERVLYIPNSEDFPTVKCIPVDLSGEWESGTEITEDMLREKATEYLRKVNSDAEINISLSFVQLQKMMDYKNLQILERAKLCDIVNVKIPKLNINATAKIIKVVYDSIKERYDTMEIGQPKGTLAGSINAVQRATENNYVKIIERQKQVQYDIEKTIKDVTAAITGNSGGYVVLHPATNPQEIFILDNPNIAEAVNVWRWNSSGLGFSAGGIEGPFDTAITADGKIVGDFVKAGEIDGNLIKAGTISAGAIDVEYTRSITDRTDSIENATAEIRNTLASTAQGFELKFEKISNDIDNQSKVIAEQKSWINFEYGVIKIGDSDSEIRSEQDNDSYQFLNSANETILELNTWGANAASVLVRKQLKVTDNWAIRQGKNGNLNDFWIGG